MDRSVYGRKAGFLHDVSFRIFVEEVQRCEQSFEKFILQTRLQSFPELPEPVQCKCNKEDDRFAQSQTQKCSIQECEVLVVSLWELNEILWEVQLVWPKRGT